MTIRSPGSRNAWGLSYITLRKVLDGEQAPQARTLQLIANYLRMEAVSTAWVRTAFDAGMAKQESLLSILTEMIEEDRLYAHDTESVAARIIEIGQHFRLPCEIEETMSWAKSKLRSPRQTYADLLAQRVALRNRLAILRERESTES
jgi:hypothetical protein